MFDRGLLATWLHLWRLNWNLLKLNWHMKSSSNLNCPKSTLFILPAIFNFQLFCCSTVQQLWIIWGRDTWTTQTLTHTHAWKNLNKVHFDVVAISYSFHGRAWQSSTSSTVAWPWGCWLWASPSTKGLWPFPACGRANSAFWNRRSGRGHVNTGHGSNNSITLFFKPEFGVAVCFGSAWMV